VLCCAVLCCAVLCCAVLGWDGIEGVPAVWRVAGQAHGWQQRTGRQLGLWTAVLQQCIHIRLQHWVYHLSYAAALFEMNSAPVGRGNTYWGLHSASGRPLVLPGCSFGPYLNFVGNYRGFTVSSCTQSEFRLKAISLTLLLGKVLHQHAPGTPEIAAALPFPCSAPPRAGWCRACVAGQAICILRSGTGDEGPGAALPPRTTREAG
jgi:hypothetical protein